MGNPLVFFKSPIAISVLIAWLLAQGIKPIISFLRTKKWDWSLLIHAGGMPSSHAATMASVTTAIALSEGWDSPIFILAISITGIVIYDATGVRRQAGFHAERINQMGREIVKDHKLDPATVDELREIIGHTPGEAVVGTIFGIAISFIVWWVRG